MDKKEVVLLLVLVFLFGCASSPRPWTGAEVALGVTSTLATAWNYHETVRMLDREGTYEKNPLFGRHPSDGKLFLGMAINQLAVLGVANWYPHVDLPVFGRCELRVPILIGKTVINSSFAMHDRGVGD